MSRIALLVALVSATTLAASLGWSLSGRLDLPPPEARPTHRITQYTGQRNIRYDAYQLVESDGVFHVKLADGSWVRFTGNLKVEEIRE